MTKGLTILALDDEGFIVVSGCFSQHFRMGQCLLTVVRMLSVVILQLPVITEYLRQDGGIDCLQGNITGALALLFQAPDGRRHRVRSYLALQLHRCQRCLQQLSVGTFLTGLRLYLCQMGECCLRQILLLCSLHLFPQCGIGLCNHGHGDQQPYSQYRSYFFAHHTSVFYYQGQRYEKLVKQPSHLTSFTNNMVLFI